MNNREWDKRRARVCLCFMDWEIFILCWTKKNFHLKWRNYIQEWRLQKTSDSTSFLDKWRKFSCSVSCLPSKTLIRKLLWCVSTINCRLTCNRHLSMTWFITRTSTRAWWTLAQQISAKSRKEKKDAIRTIARKFLCNPVY